LQAGGPAIASKLCDEQIPRSGTGREWLVLMFRTMSRTVGMRGDSSGRTQSSVYLTLLREN
jgi:hypothetical protein